MDYLNRRLAPFSGELWDRIDGAAHAAARDTLTARRFLDVDGPYGVGFTSLDLGPEDYCRQPADDEAGAVLSRARAVPVPLIRRSFELALRRIVAAEEHGVPLDLTAVQEAAEAVAIREEEFIYEGSKGVGLEGLLTVEGRASIQQGDWKSVDRALGDVLKAVEALDKKGFYGPYALALPAVQYNQLFRRYEGSDVLQVEHLKRLCELGVFKARISAAVLVDPQVGRIIVGQDLMTGYAGTDGIRYQLFANESIVLKVEEPGAVCILDRK